MFEKFIEGVAGGIGGSILGSHAARQGASMDYRYGLKKEAALWDRAQERGLTPQEYYGSPAPGGAANFSSGGGQIIGNQAGQMAQQALQLGQQQRENEKNRQTQLAQTQIQSDTAKYVADTQAGTQKRGQDINREVADRAYNLDERKFQEVTLRESASNLNVKEQQIAKAVNEVITSSPKWLMMMKNLTMGSENMWVQSYIEHTGINPITDPESFKKLPKSEREKFLLGFLAFGSSTTKEVSGISALLGLDRYENEPRPPSLGAGDKGGEWKEHYKNPWFTIRKRQ